MMKKNNGGNTQIIEIAIKTKITHATKYTILKRLTQSIALLYRLSNISLISVPFILPPADLMAEVDSAAVTFPLN